MDKAFTAGRFTLLLRFTTGFGFYIETIPLQLRPAMALPPDAETEDDIVYAMIEYKATAIKLPFFTIELGSFTPVEIDVSESTLLDMLERLEEGPDDDDSEDSSTLH